MLSSFEQNIQVAIIGASGGIGQALVEKLSSSQQVKSIAAFSRSKVSFDNDKVTAYFIDITSEQSIFDASTSISDASLDIILDSTGLLHDESLQPEKTLKAISLDKLQQVFLVNAFGPALIIKYFVSKLKRQQKSILAINSARVGSISDNHLGGWYAYRSAKAALNMLIKTTAIELRRINSQAIICGYHPGTVDTNLSKPFQANVPAHKLFSPDQAATYYMQTIDQLSSKDSGKVFAWDGKEVIP